MKKLIFLILLYSSHSFSAVTLEEFNHLKVAINKSFLILRPSSDHELTINLTTNLPDNYWWSLDVIHASYSRLDNTHNIFIFGGFARLEEMTLDGLAITACHELGHGIGGPPYKSSGSSMEGQADYFATKVCLPVVYSYLAASSNPTETPFNLDFCTNSEDFNFCLRALTALESNIFFYKTLGDEVHFETPATELAARLDYSPTYYPSSQCRLDTSLNGILGLKRPGCWYPEVN